MIKNYSNFLVYDQIFYGGKGWWMEWGRVTVKEAGSGVVGDGWVIKESFQKHLEIGGG